MAIIKVTDQTFKKEADVLYLETITEKKSDNNNFNYQYIKRPSVD